MNRDRRGRARWRRVGHPVHAIGSVVALVLAAACVPAAPADPASEHPPDPALSTGGPAALVDPFVGTAPAASSSPVPGGTAGDTFPGAAVPFGAVQWSPDTPHAENPAGYAWSDSTIEGFSLTHFSGAGCANSGLVRFVPGTDGRAGDAVAFTHDNETARPGSYEVTLDDGVRVELSATTRAGIGRFSFPSGATPTIAIDNGVRDNTFPLLDLPTLRAVDDRTIVGTAVGGGFCGAPTSFRMHFLVEFSRPFTVASYDPLHRVALRFDGAAGANLIARTGVSWVSDDGARANLAAEVPGWSYGEVRNAAYEQWNAMLARLRVGGGTEAQQRTFSTALYHSLLHPNVASDVDGRYLGFDGYVHTTSPGSVHLVNFSGWDIYRSQVQLIALLAPDVAKDLSQSLLDDALQCGGGFPKWTLANQEALVMIGDPGALMVSNLDAFGAGGDDVAGVLEVMRRSADTPGTTCGYRTLRPALGSYLSKGYTPTLPASVEGDVARYLLGALFDTADASTTLEYAVADTAIGQYAARHGDAELASRLLDRGTWWEHLFDPATGYVRPRLLDGTFAPDFDPSSLFGFTEGNAAQYTWMVPQDYTRLVELLGGPAAATSRLDSLFEEVNAGITEPHFYIGNEPQFPVPWAYAWAGAPARTQDVVRRIIDAAFGDTPAGLPGNDDLGATSSWLVWASIGMFPAVPGQDVLTLNTPLFPTVDIAVPGRDPIHLRAAGAPDHRYVAAATLDGAPLERAWLRFADLDGGATLVFTTSDSPGPWGSGPGLAPPSLRP